MNEDLSLTQIIEKFLIHFIKFLLSHKKLLTLFFLLGVAIGILFYSLTKNQLKTRLIAKTSVFQLGNIHTNNDEYLGNELVINRADAISAAQSLNILLQDKKKFSKVLNIKKENAENLIEFSTDSVQNTNYFYIELKYKRPVDLLKLENGIINYIHSIPIIKNKMLLAKKNNELLIERLDSQLLKLNNLQISILEGINKPQPQNNMVVVERNNLFHHRDIIDFGVIRRQCIQNIETATVIDVSQSFSFVSSQRFPLMISIFVSTFCFTLIGFFVAVFNDMYKKI